MRPTELCAFLISGGTLYDSHLGLPFREKLIKAGALYIYEMESEWNARMHDSKICSGGKFKCDTARLAAIREMTFRDALVLREPIPKDKLALFGC